MLQLMSEEHFNSLWTTSQTPACDEGLKLAYTFLDACGDTLDVRNEADLDVTRFAFNRAWFDYSRHRKSCIRCLSTKS